MADERKLSRLDLNMLLALDALITERSVSRAADRLGLSQPALSASLSRIRRHFDDPILIRRGNAFELSPLAIRVAPHASVALGAARRVFDSQVDWTPAGSTREFTFYGSDHSIQSIGPAVSRLAAVEAPDVRLRFNLQTPAIVEDAAVSLRSVDGLVLPHGFVTGLPHADLWHDDWVVVLDPAHPAADRALTIEDLRSAHWVQPYQSRSAFTLASRQLQHLGIEPVVDVVVETFLALPDFVVGTERLALLQRRLAERIAPSAGLRIAEPPFDASALLVALWWHPIYTDDPEHAWIRGLFERAGRESDRYQRG